MKALEVRIYGIVQGVGFRPFVDRLARRLGLKGWVSNEGGTVHILVKGEPAGLDLFLQELEAAKPGPSFIVLLEKHGIPPETVTADGFSIRESEDRSGDLVFLPPDMPMCPECQQELAAPGDRRYRHPFISCMLCGPRYTIIDRVPYDRENTTMEPFVMCPACQAEYDNIRDRRYHAQTVSCHECGPILLYRDYRAHRDQTGAKRDVSGTEALTRAVEALQSGEIVAVKGIGGYHLACSPYSAEAVRLLREMKGREAKPFAVNFPDITSLQEYCEVDETGKRALLAPERPIVLLPKKKNTAAPEFSPLVDGESPDHGVFLPYTPFQALLLQETGALIMTSANISDQPLIRDDREMLGFSHPGLAGVLYHEREITTGVDDSVVRPVGTDIQVIRRARGYVPLPIALKSMTKEAAPSVLACGGMLKSAFCLTHKNFAYLSQHLGDLGDARTWQDYCYNLERMQRLLKIKPDLVCCDLHPDYPTTRLALELSPHPVRVQHHHAHIASVMAEYGLSGEVAGLAFDGTGYGTDGKMWGGEFLLCTPSGFSRAAHLRYIPLSGGDSSVRECWKTAACYLFQAGLEDLINDPRWPLLKAAWRAGVNTLESSSMGRLFDAAGSILGLCQVAGYEGEGAVRLETAALRWLNDRPLEAAGGFSYEIEEKDGVKLLNFLPLIREMAAQKKGGADAGLLAARFHGTVAQAAAGLCREICTSRGVSTVVLSGGVFQNRLLLGQVKKHLEEEGGLQVYYNTMVPPNDGGIALGQAYVSVHSHIA